MADIQTPELAVGLQAVWLTGGKSMSRALLATVLVLLTLSGTSIAQENPQPTQKAEPEQRAVPERSTGERAVPRETASRPTPPPPTADRGRSTSEKAVRRESASRPEPPPPPPTNTRGDEQVVDRSGSRRSDSGEA
ncbi:MAG: hypothetical protein ACRD1T_22885, partial [Acidimicrobiia bacterium]